eukprot:scaffold31949_cov146-Isochrysis_galbana.AAC.3
MAHQSLGPSYHLPIAVATPLRSKAQAPQQMRVLIPTTHLARRLKPTNHHQTYDQIKTHHTRPRVPLVACRQALRGVMQEAGQARRKHACILETIGDLEIANCTHYQQRLDAVIGKRSCGRLHVRPGLARVFLIESPPPALPIDRRDASQLQL